MSVVIRRARLIRESRSLSLHEVARATGLDPGQLSRFERNVRGLQYDALRTLSKFYRVPIDELRKVETIEDGAPMEAMA